MLLACLILLPIKNYVYGPICFFPLLILVRRWKSNRKEALLAGAILLFCVAVFAFRIILPMIQRTGQFSSEVTMAYDGSEEYTLQYFIDDPKEILRVILNTFTNSSEYYFETLIGDALQWLNVGVNNLYLYFYVVLLALAAFRRKGEEVILNTRTKLYMQLTAWAGIVAVLTALLIAYSPIAMHRVMGAQGRYFIPCFPLLLLTVRSKGISIARSYEPGILVATFFCLHAVVQWILMARSDV